jgi:hypothetical protein
MANTTEVSPGQLITADLINELLKRIAALEAHFTSDGNDLVVTPTVFGRTLADARAILQIPGTRLTLGTVFDAAGLVVDVNVPDNADRLVINQVPAANQEAIVDSPVRLVLAATIDSSNGGDNQAPQITGVVPLNPPAGHTDQAPVNSPIRIDGQNFSPVPSLNNVTFDGAPATVASGGKTQLFVSVPSNLPNMPPPGGQVTVTVKVQIGTGQPATASLIVVPAAAVPPPAIQDASPDPAVLNKPLTIKATGLGAAAGAITLFFGVADGSPQASPQPQDFTGDSFTVTVPNIDAVTNSQVPVSVPLRLKVGASFSAPFPHDISRS